MNFGFTEEEQAFRKEVQEFVGQEMTEEIRSRWLGGLLDTPARRDFVTKMAQRGWLTMGFPEEYGGSGDAMPLAQYILNEELHMAQAPIVGKNLGVVVNTLLHHGSEQLKQEFVPRILRNEIQWALAYTEPEAGSDLANMQMRAVLDGDEYVLNGQKRFITSAHFADYMWTGVRTDPDAPKHKGISLLIIDADAPGITVTPLWTIIGERTNDVFFDNVRVPKDRLVGEENHGWRYITTQLDFERVAISPTAHIERVFHWLCDRLLTPPDATDDAWTRATLARMAADLNVLKVMDHKVAAMVANGEVPVYEASLLKVVSNEFRVTFFGEALQMLGSAGLVRRGADGALLDSAGDSIERQLRESPVNLFGGGSNDVQRDLIAIHGLGLSR
jgi:alkylation response protein AidB-like acyl-CoA dehydrogenase